MTTIQNAESEVYQGQFGEFTITESDRQGVIIYRAGLMAAALSFALGTLLVLKFASYAFVPVALNVLYICFSIGLAVSLLMIHIYLAPLHRALQAFWLAGTVAAIAIALTHSEPLALAVYHQPTTILGIGFIFAALTGIFFKEAFCFNRLETKLLTPLVPLLLLGHLFGILSVPLEQVLLGLWAALFVVFALRKVVQPIPPDIGDKSVFVYLKQQAAVE
ncbi:DUF2301 domain-containing membrane protein [Cyanobacteria bacterium FACHB-471]|nr:DUF2301 domain-containing membrane protein [Cyanobacteria bacterium FACHB-471]